jgi:hypothetical protein
VTVVSGAAVSVADVASVVDVVDVVEVVDVVPVSVFEVVVAVSPGVTASDTVPVSVAAGLLSVGVCRLLVLAQSTNPTRQTSKDTVSADVFIGPHRVNVWE